jgi:hypothetical protein
MLPSVKFVSAFSPAADRMIAEALSHWEFRPATRGTAGGGDLQRDAVATSRHAGVFTNGTIRRVAAPVTRVGCSTCAPVKSQRHSAYEPTADGFLVVL